MSEKEPGTTKKAAKQGRPIGSIATQYGSFGSANDEEEDVTSKTVSQHDSIPVKQDASTSVPQEASTPAKQQDSTPVLMKGTYYITPEDDMKLERIRLARRGQGHKVDKSALIREAISLLQE